VNPLKGITIPRQLNIMPSSFLALSEIGNPTRQGLGIADFI
jgi:hypothetical protein